MNRSSPIKSKQRGKKRKKEKREKWPPFLHFHIGDLHTRRWTSWTWLGGRRTWLGGRLEPLREFGILPFLLGGLVGITCVVMWVHESLQGSNSLPLRGVGSQSLTEARDWVLCVASPWAVAWKCQSMRSMPCRTACAAVTFYMVLHGRARGPSASRLRVLFSPYRTPWRHPIGRRRGQALKEKPAKEEPK